MRAPYQIIIDALEELDAATDALHAAQELPEKVHLETDLESSRRHRKVARLQAQKDAAQKVRGQGCAKGLPRDRAGVLRPRASRGRGQPWGSVMSDRRSWAGFEWPEWVPTEVREAVESFWGPESFGRGRDNYEKACDFAYGPVAPMGERVPCWKLMGRTVVSGRYVHLWNNIGAVVRDDGSWCRVSGEATDPAIARRVGHLETEAARLEEQAARLRDERAVLAATHPEATRGVVISETREDLSVRLQGERARLRGAIERTCAHLNALDAWLADGVDEVGETGEAVAVSVSRRERTSTRQPETRGE